MSLPTTFTDMSASRRGGNGVYPGEAVEWRIGPPDDFHAGWSEIRVVTILDREGHARFAVKMRGWTANHDAEWEYEPIPSRRDDDYLERCRWDDWGDAVRVADKMVDLERSKWERQYGTGRNSAAAGQDERHGTTEFADE